MPFYFFIVGHTIEVFSTAEYRVLEHCTVNSYLGTISYTLSVLRGLADRKVPRHTCVTFCTSSQVRRKNVVTPLGEGEGVRRVGED